MIEPLKKFFFKRREQDLNDQPRKLSKFQLKKDNFSHYHKKISQNRLKMFVKTRCSVNHTNITDNDFNCSIIAIINHLALLENSNSSIRIFLEKQK